jgi:hypothetical protein
MNKKRSAAFPYSVFPLTFLVWVVLLCLPEKAFGQCPTTDTYTSGTGTFTVPAGTTSITIEAWGGGGAGGGSTDAGNGANNNRAGAGGGGGAYSIVTLSNASFSVGDVFNIAVGNGGPGVLIGNGNPGNPSFITRGATTLINAVGGGGGAGNPAIVAPPAPPAGGAGGNTGVGTITAGTSGGDGATGNNVSSGNGGNGGNGGAGGIAISGNITSPGNLGNPIGGGGSGSRTHRDGGGRTGGNGARGEIRITYTVAANTVTSTTPNQTVCINTALTPNITHTTTGATGIGVPVNLPAGITAVWTGNTITISGTPTASGTFGYSIPLTGGCTTPAVNATGIITVTPNNTAGTISSSTFCQGTALPAGVTQSTTGATGIGAPSNLPQGITAAWASNQITFTGTPTAFGNYSYTIPLTGGCGVVNATGTITINETPVIKSFTAPGGTQCITTDFPDLSVGTGFGYTYQWYQNSAANNTTGTAIVGQTSNTLDPFRTPAVTTYYYVVVSSPTCTPVPSSISAAYIVTPANTVTAASAAPTVCINPAVPVNITHTTTGATNIGVALGLPTGVTASWSANTIIIAGTPSVSGVFNYTIPLDGGCGTLNGTGTITVNAQAAIIAPNLSPLGQTRCINTAAFSPISVGLGQGFTYQWYSNDTQDYTTPTLISGATLNSYSPLSNAAGTTYYYVIVSSLTCGTTATSAPSGAFVVNPLSVVTFTAQPSGTLCVDTDLIYTTQPGQSTYVWTIPGLAGTDYTVSGLTTNSITVRWLTPGNKTVSVNYTAVNNCGATTPATSNTITVRKNTVNPPSNPNPSSCYTGAFTLITHTTTLATGIANAGVSGGNGLPLGLSAIWTGNATSGTITISGTVDPTVTPGPKAYSIPLSGGCGTVAATGIINVEPEYTLTSISSVSPSSTGGSATITLNLIPSTLATGSFVVNYSMGLANPRAATNVTVNFTNGVGTFFTSSITNENLTSLTINSVRKASEPTSCPVLINANNITFFGIQPKIYPSNGTFYVPAGIFQITVEVYGGGGGGGYSEQIISVTPGEAIGIFVGVGGNGQTSAGTPAGNGGTSWATRDSSSPNLPTTGFAYAYGGSGANGGTAGAGGVGQTNSGNIGNNPTVSAGGQGGKGGGVDGGAGGAGGISGNVAANRGKPGIPFGGGGGGSINDQDGGPGASGYVIITYPLPPIGPCFKVIDDGAISGTAIIEFTCNTSWTAPVGLLEFTVTSISGGGGGGMGKAAGGGGAGGFAQQTVNVNAVAGLPANSIFQVAVGQGGSGAPNESTRGESGGISSVTGPVDGSNITIAPSSGGGGGGSTNSVNGGAGESGASGGGGAYDENVNGPDNRNNGGNGTTGFSGGGVEKKTFANDITKGAAAGGGGGGAAGPGANGAASGAGNAFGGNAGAGLSFVIGGVTYYRGGGGGGNGFNFEGQSVKQSPGVGGSAPNGSALGGNGVVNGIGGNGVARTGSGGGSGTVGGGSGGTGRVFITYPVFRILPVEYLYFNAEFNPTFRSGNLSWATTKEWENSHFEIERSVNGVTSWTKIGEMEGQGYSEITTGYKFMDAKLPAAGGVVYYRLKQVDFDDKFTYSITKSIKVDGIKGKGAWIAYPNPSSKKSTVTVDLLNRSVYNDEPILIQISDIRGVAETFTVNQIESVSEVVNEYLDRSIQGVYILQLIWGNNSQQIKLLRE